MFCKGYTRAGTDSTTGKPLVIADLLTKTAPATMPTTTDNIDNVGAGMLLAPGSTLMETNPFKLSFLNDEYEWDEV